MHKFYKSTSYFLLVLAMTSCAKKQATVWDDHRPASQLTHERNALWGGDPLSRSAATDDFIPLQEEDLKAQLSDGAVPLSGDLPGEEGSSLPGADQFHSPAGSLATIFKNLHFNTDDHILRSKEQLQLVDGMARYLKAHPKTFIFVEGHCDQRGPQAYNLALGARRANYVRTLFIERGVDPGQLHTISYGKERLVDERNISDAWSKNRRAEFKLYNKL